MLDDDERQALRHNVTGILRRMAASVRDRHPELTWQANDGLQGDGAVSSWLSIWHPPDADPCIEISVVVTRRDLSLHMSADIATFSGYVLADLDITVSADAGHGIEELARHLQDFLTTHHDLIDTHVR